MDVHRLSQGAVKCREFKKTRQDIDFSEVLRKKQAKERVDSIQVPQAKKPHLVSLGIVKRQTPSVSSLLIRHPAYRKDCWNILNDERNRDKPYTRIRSGTEIYLNPETKEILWGKMVKENGPSGALAGSGLSQPADKQESTNEPHSFSQRFVGAVKPYYGKPYGEMNCYELLVKGLTKLGVRYAGAGGLGRRLMVMARERGLPMNAYFNGEGLIEASGSPVYSKTLLQVRSPDRQASQVIREIQPYLEEGQILSFSIHSQGHTGIVSRARDTWTLINSGEMDHALNKTNQRNGVGEESLEAEIRNWFVLAKSRKESLRITLGSLNEQKLLAFYEHPPSKPKQV